jgi:hypothetical protein
MRQRNASGAHARTHAHAHTYARTEDGDSLFLAEHRAGRHKHAPEHLFQCRVARRLGGSRERRRLHRAGVREEGEQEKERAHNLGAADDARHRVHCRGLLCV